MAKYDYYPLFMGTYLEITFLPTGLVGRQAFIFQQSLHYSLVRLFSKNQQPNETIVAGIVCWYKLQLKQFFLERPYMVLILKQHTTFL